MQLTKLYSRLMTLMFEEEILVNWYWFISSKVTKNVARSNEEIDKIMEFMDKEIGTVKDFLSSLSWTSPLKVFSQGKSSSSEYNLQLKERKTLMPFS